jgi:hypothetical protein
VLLAELHESGAVGLAGRLRVERLHCASASD